MTRKHYIVIFVFAIGALFSAWGIRDGNWPDFWLNLGAGFIGSIVTYLLLEAYFEKRNTLIHAIESFTKVLRSDNIRARDYVLLFPPNGADFRDVNFDMVNLKSAHVARFKFLNCRFLAASFEGAAFENAKFVSCEMGSALLNGATFQRCEFRSMIFRNSQFNFAIFENCAFEACRFIGCDVANTRFVNCMADRNMIDASCSGEFLIETI